MTRVLPHILTVVLLAVVAACAGNDPTQGPAVAGGDEEERPTVAVTRWTERTELFMEYPVFVAGESGRSAIHVTDLNDFSPLTVGQAIVVLRADNGEILEFSDGPSRPGIFGVDLVVERPGVYDMSLRVEAPDLADLHELGPVTVHPSGETLPADDESDQGFSFLKEQQWVLEFGTTPAAPRKLRPSLSVPAIVRARAGGEVQLTAPVPGRIDPATDVPVPGARVRAGAVLTRIVPGSDDLRDAPALRAALVEVEQAHLLAVRERDRAERLVEGRALPARRLDEAEAAVVGSQAKLDAARERWKRYEALSQSGERGSGEGAFAVRAPFDGVVSEIRFAPGASVEDNQVLLRLFDPERVHIVGAVPESQAEALASVTAGELFRVGEPPLALAAPLTIGRFIEPLARTSEVRFAFDNRSARLQLGQSVGLRLFLGDAVALIAVPESALVDDDGRPVVFVQTGGESFERRPINLGSRDGGWVHVIQGLSPGERVVHRGAYLVRMASMSDQVPTHGHVH